jgi:CO dehydrogenase nickel-insertion accessory protein CooC1
LILQGKGGVGKSFIAALLGQIFGSGHEPQNSHMELGRSGVGVGRVYMRYFGACASLIKAILLSSPWAR